jgi:hypothetical protein
MNLKRDIKDLKKLKKTVSDLIFSFVMSGISLTMNSYNLKN